MKDEFRTEMRDYAWRYFALHSDQRIKTFNFYLIVFGLVAGGLISLLKEGNHYLLGAPVAFCLAFISFVFWRLDVRNKELIKHSEEALKLLEDDKRLPDAGNMPNRLKLFVYEEHATDNLKKERLLHCIRRHYSYSNCFNAMFFVFGSVGLIVGIVLLFLASTAC